MPRYKIQAPDGRTVTIEGPTPPTEADLDAIFAQLPERAASATAPTDAAAAEPEAQPEHWSARLMKSALKQVPLTAMDALSLPTRATEAVSDVVGGALFGDEAVQRARDLRETVRYQSRAPYEPTADEGTAGAIGRGITQAAPQVGLAALTGGMSIPQQMAMQGAAQGAQTLGEGGTGGEAALSGAVGAVAPVLGVGASKVAKDMAPRVVNSLIKPLAKQFRFGRDPGRGIIKEGIVATTRNQLAKQLSAKLDDIGTQIQKNLTRPEIAKKMVDVRPAMKEVDSAIQQAGKRGERLLVNRLKELRDSLTKNLDIETGEFTTPRPMEMSPLDAHALKRQIGEASKWTGQAFDNEVNQARVAVYRVLNRLIDDAAPGTKSLQSRYADMLTAQSSLERLMTMQGRNNLLSLPDVIIGTGGGAAALANPAALGLAVGAIAGRHALGSAGAKTLAGQVLSRFPNTTPALQALLRGGASKQSPQER